jgi:hypothetical protein
MIFPGYSQWYIVALQDGSTKEILACRSITKNAHILFLDSKSNVVEKIRYDAVHSMTTREAEPHEVAAIDPHDPFGGSTGLPKY